MRCYLTSRSGRLAVWTAGALSTLACTGVADANSLPNGPPAPPPALVPIANIELLPASVTLFTGGRQPFTATGRFSDGTTSRVSIVWSATGGTISPTGVYEAGSVPGVYVVVASDSVSHRSDTSLVTIAPAPPPGQYQTIAAEDWRNYADKSALSGMFGVEGGLNKQPPALPVTDFYDLVDDPVFGKAVRYNGGPHLNISQTNMPGRVATHTAKLRRQTQINATWWTPPLGTGTDAAHNVDWFPTHVWVRQFIRFSPNWTNLSSTGGQGSGDYKAMFLRYFNNSARHEFKVTNLREWVMDGGNPGLTKVDQGTLPWRNVEIMNVEYQTTGFFGVDLYPMVRPSTPSGECFPANAPCALAGDGEWYEIVMHHKTVAERGEFTQYIRRYTAAGVVSPGPWRINARYVVVAPGQVFRGISNYQMGVNRNRQYDEVMYHDWGPYEVVDGSVYPNPWGLPGGN